MIYKAADATITFEEIVMVMINTEITVANILTPRLLGIKNLTVYQKHNEMGIKNITCMIRF